MRGTEGFTTISDLYPTSVTDQAGWDTTMTSSSTAQEMIEATEGTIFPRGNVGIGNTSPSYQSGVTGTFQATSGSALVVQGGQNGGTGRGMFVDLSEQ